MQMLPACRNDWKHPMKASAFRYEPPEEWRAEQLVDLLEHGRRGLREARQQSFLAKVTKGEGDEADGRVFVAGDLDLLSKRCVAVIGARKATDAGRKRARQFARQLAERDVVVVSGLADGIDAEALDAAIDAGGRVIAVIGTPLDQAYPAKNKRLQEAIYKDHLLVSQFTSGSRVYPSNFPARNRTMAALSDASVVIEASDTSGTLHQAAECQRLGRWLGIAKSVMTDPDLSWPTKFQSYARCVQLETTAQFLSAIYAE